MTEQSERGIGPNAATTSESEQDMLALKGLLLDIDCLDPLDEWADTFNIFDVLGVARAEIRHSNVLGWLLDPNESHGLGDAVIRGFLNHVATGENEGVDVFDTLLLDCNDFTVRREWRNIDILAISARERYVVCIENKIGTGEHDAQLNRYRAIIESQYPGYRHAFIYLSPDGSSPSDPERWMAMSYADVLDIVETARRKTRSPADAGLLIDNYIETIRRDVVGDERLEQICAEIYSKHRRALDLIYEHKPDRASSLAATIIAWAEQRDAEGAIALDRAKCSKRYTRFTTAAMSKALPDTDEANSSWGTKNHYFYEVVNNGGESFKSHLSLNREGSGPDLIRRFESIIASASSRPKQDWTFHVPFSTPSYAVSEETPEEEIFKQLDKQLDRLTKFEAKVASHAIEDAQGAEEAAKEGCEE